MCSVFFFSSPLSSPPALPPLPPLSLPPLLPPPSFPCQFDPDLIMISCGLDAAMGDPLGNCCITPSGYAHMTHLLMGLAGGRIVVALEVCMSTSQRICTVCSVGFGTGSLLRTVDEGRVICTCVPCIHLVLQHSLALWHCLAVLSPLYTQMYTVWLY